ncbi:single-stranded DNA-binding protein [Natronoglycomyces albus]|uniref:Single-stranded DNA-binding protein n=2 Tax=Natronoglycomyces albus TaxID=2811108 RepID=A0A895XSX9_9ACTN|nr:R3H domain-containing nucleic acid-binding protein [Natronoglycomyces albus]QSB05370.1 single-stranded DNA-binding protein [Natronoglycomyces albus]
MTQTVREDEVTSEDELFDQSEVAADYLEGLLDVLDSDGDIDELVVGDRPQVEIVGDGLEKLVGQKGQTLEALQELARLAVYRKIGEHSRLMLDIGGYRANRRKKLAELAKKTAAKVIEQDRVVKLDPMGAFERKCVHDVINATDGVESESEGAEPHRRVVVKPA